MKDYYEGWVTDEPIFNGWMVARIYDEARYNPRSYWSNLRIEERSSRVEYEHAMRMLAAAKRRIKNSDRGSPEWIQARRDWLNWNWIRKELFIARRW